MRYILLILCVALSQSLFAQWSGSTTTTGSINRQGKVTLNSAGWDQHLEITRTGFGGAFQPDNSSGYFGLRLQLVGGGSNFYVMNGNVGIGTSSPSSKLHVYDDGGSGGEQFRLQRGVGVVRFVQNWNTDDLHLYNRDGSKLYMYWKQNGHVGIGTTSPDSRLHIYDDGSSGGEQLRIQRGTGIVRFVQNFNTDDLYLYNRDASKMYMYWRQDGNVGIGTTSPDAKLAVKGTVHAEEVKVDLSVPGPDYVFEENYALQSLEEIESYVKVNKHLPDVPSAKEMAEEGIKVGEMNMLLLRKIEEMTLHMIEQSKQLNDMHQFIINQQSEIEKFKSEMK